MDLQPGTFVNSNVCLVRQLGEGGMGSVWLADHLSLRTRVAVKFISAELVRSEPTVVERFTREAALCAQIKSPHVVQTFDHGVMADGRPYIVMELLEGESLQTRLDRVGYLSLQETRAVVLQTARALGKAHRLGVVHRVFKPDNLFLTPDDDEPFLLKVLDFGIAKQTGMQQAAKMTSTGSMVGTPEYMSPEQVLSGNTVDLRSDLWAIAVVAYRCLTGTVPFLGETLGSLCVSIAHGRYRSPRELRPELLPSVDRWFERALAVDRERRHHSAKELAQTFSFALLPNDTLEDFTTGEGLPAQGFAPDANGFPSFAGAHKAGAVVSPQRGPSPRAGSASGPAVRASTRTAVMLTVGGLALLGSGIYFVVGAPNAPAPPIAAADPSNVEAVSAKADAPPPAPPPPALESAAAQPGASASAPPSPAPNTAPQATPTARPLTLPPPPRPLGASPPPPPPPPLPREAPKDRGF